MMDTLLGQGEVEEAEEEEEGKGEDVSTDDTAWSTEDSAKSQEEQGEEQGSDDEYEYEDCYEIWESSPRLVSWEPSLPP